MSVRDSENGVNEKPPLEGMTVTIERVVAGGDGLGRHPDGRVVLVPRTAPGDRVEAVLTEDHRQWLRARLARIVAPGPGRRVPPCPHYEACGGCQLQHLDYETQLIVKSTIIEDSLRRLGGFEAGAPEIVPSPREFEYRNRIAVVFRRRGEDAALGYHALGTPDAVVDIDRCPLAEPAINESLTAVRAFLESAGPSLPPRADWRLTFRADSTGRVGLAIEGDRRPPSVDRGVLEGLLDCGLAAVWVVGRSGGFIARAGLSTLGERWGGVDLPLAGTAFLQVNRGAAALLDAHVIDRCPTGGAKVIDAYCGFALRALHLAERGASVVGVESDAAAVRAARDIAASRGTLAQESGGPPSGPDCGGSVRLIADRVERALGRELPADTVILNPPRGGVAPEVIAALLKAPPKRLIYVSCNPATLARDLKRLGSAYGIAETRAFDLFPQTASVETVIVLDRAR